MKVTNKLGLPHAMVTACESDYEYRTNRYSVTALTAPLRQTILKRRHDAELSMDVSEMIWLILGKAVHALVEDDTENTEKRLEHEIDGMTISGIADHYDPKTETVTDYKTASTWKITYNDHADVYRQLRLYAWLLNHTAHSCKRLQVVYILKDHNMQKAKAADYPPLPVHVEKWGYAKSDWLEDETYVINKIKEIVAAEKILPLCTPDDRWYSGTTYAVMRKGRKRAVKLHSTIEDATAHADADKSLYVETRPGINKRCEEYCSVADYCDQWQKIKEGS